MDPAANNPERKEPVKIDQKKKWKEYFFEFLLVFLAVVLGFFAESIREQIEDRKKEKKYVRSLIVDINNDYKIAYGNSIGLINQADVMDELEAILLSAMRNDTFYIKRAYNQVNDMIKLYGEFFYKRTITQLLSSGNMRLIRDQAVADSIMTYYSYLDFIETQKRLYTDDVNIFSKSIYDVFDIYFLRTEMNEEGLFVAVEIDSSKLKFNSYDPPTLKKFIAILETAKNSVLGYQAFMVDIQERTQRLSDFLHQEYDFRKKEEKENKKK